MDIWIAKLLGPIILVLSIPVILTPGRLHEITRQFLADGPLVLISGVLVMAAGLAIVNTHNVWLLGWPLIVTVFGWALVVSGAVRIVAPTLVDEVGTAMLARPQLTRLAGVVWGALGAFLSIKGYA